MLSTQVKSVILSEYIKGKTTDEVFTAVRSRNHSITYDQLVKYYTTELAHYALIRTQS